VLLYTILQGAVPFKASSLEELHAMILRCNFKYPTPISEEVRSLIEAMLVVESERRISIPEILRHPWLRECALDELACTEEEDDHDFQVGLSFGRHECNLNPLAGSTAGGETARSN